ncbi:MAG: DNA-3-methyladenine glycosylase [Rickettsiaceae bacterium]|nr:DNA-3-methyladenine glycosylase [Rickettsiaceae bacterium]
MLLQQGLSREFFSRNTVDVARDLLGKKLIFGSFTGIITETEAYRGNDDPASHAYKRATPRSKIMFGLAGFTYVYLIYGMYHCLNITTENENQPGAVLIRGLQIYTPNNKLLDGPGKICRQLAINKDHNNIDVTSNNDFYFTDSNNRVDFQATPRIGISNGQDKLWRFIINHPPQIKTAS